MYENLWVIKKKYQKMKRLVEYIIHSFSYKFDRRIKVMSYLDVTGMANTFNTH